VNEHEAIRELLALGAAGALDPAEERRVREHAAACQACADELRSWQALAGELAALPVPQAPPAMVARTRARVEAVLRVEADRRWDEAVLAFLALFAWTVGLATWAVWRLVTGGAAGLAVIGLTESLNYLTVSTLLAWLTAGVAAIIAGQRRRAVGRNL
jgi:anti-sigma factor RsiW